MERTQRVPRLGWSIVYLSSRVGADVHPGLCCVEPEQAHGPHSVVGQHDGHVSVQGHGVVELVLEHIQIVQPVGVSTTGKGGGEIAKY